MTDQTEITSQPRFFETENSLYQIDHECKRIRRLHGNASPTPRQGSDGTWRSFEDISAVSVGSNVIIVWRYGNNVAQSTITSPVRNAWDGQN